MTKKLLVVLVLVGLLALPGCGQRSDTVYQTVFTNATSVTPPVAIRNNGQDLHQVFIQWVNNGANVCATSNWVFWIYLEGSFDNIAWDTITYWANTGGPPKNRLGDLNRSMYGRGSYPYIRVRIANNDDVNCKVNAWYSGNISGQNREVAVYDSTQENPDIQTLSVGSTVIGDFPVFAGVANYKVTIFGLTISNDTATQTFILKCSDGMELLRLYNMTAGQVVVWPNTGKAHAFCTYGTNLVGNINKATPLAVSIKATLF